MLPQHRRGLPMTDLYIAVTKAALERALAHAEAHLEGLDQRPVASTTALPELRRRLGVPLGNGGMAASTVIDELIAACEGGHLGSAGGRFFAWVIGGSLPSALAADWLTATWDQNAALHACGPAAAVVEEVAGGWLKDVLQLPESASFAFTTGCQMAHVTCLAAGRHAVLQSAGWDVEARGLCGAPRLKVITSEQQHGSMVRAVRLLGIGQSDLIALPTGEDGKLPADALTGALQAHAGPKIVILQAGDLNVGAFDDFRTLVPLAKNAGAWVHIDGAFGLWMAAEPSRRHLLDGAAGADSWATDAHKWLNVPYDNGIAFVRDPDIHFATMSHRASYIAAAEDARDQIDWNPEWSRRARGFPVYAALRELGRDGIADLIARTSNHARTLAEGIAALPGAELVALSEVNQGLVRFLDPGAAASDSDHDRRTDMVIAQINRSGEAFFSGTTWRGKRAMRISVCNWRTSEDDVRRTIAAVEQVLTQPDKHWCPVI